MQESWELTGQDFIVLCYAACAVYFPNGIIPTSSSQVSTAHSVDKIATRRRRGRRKGKKGGRKEERRENRKQERKKGREEEKKNTFSHYLLSFSVGTLEFRRQKRLTSKEPQQAEGY